MEETMKLEEAFTELEKILNIMDGQELTLEESFEYYQKGVQLLDYCNQSIQQVEKKIQILTGEGEMSEF
jgi:exodeoxyribonuclease VII small subunit